MAVVLAGVALVSACTSGEPAGKTAPPTSSQPPVERFAVEQKPLWSSSRSSEPTMVGGAGYVRFLGDSLLLQDSTGNLSVVDPVTGKPRWTTASAGRQARVELDGPDNHPPQVLDAGKDSSTIMSYWSSNRTGQAGKPEQGVATVALQTGKIRWTAPLPERLARLPHVGVSEPAATDGEIAVNVIVNDDDPWAATAWAVDASDGSTLWDKKDVWPQAISNGTVLGSTSKYPPDMHQDGDRPYVTALDSRSGTEKWDLKGRYGESRLNLIAGDVALLSTLSGSSGNSTGSDKYAAVVIDAATGEELANLGDIRGDKLNCASDGRSLIACTVLSGEGQGQRLATFDVAKREVHLSPKHDDPAQWWSWNVQGVWDGHIFVNDSSAVPEEEFRAVDRDGNVISGKLPGRLVGKSDKYAVFTDLVDSPGGAYALYQVTTAS